MWLLNKSWIYVWCWADAKVPSWPGSTCSCVQLLFSVTTAPSVVTQVPETRSNYSQVHEWASNPTPSCLIVMIMTKQRNGYWVHVWHHYIPFKSTFPPFCTRKFHCKPDLEGVLYFGLGFTHKFFLGTDTSSWWHIWDFTRNVPNALFLYWQEDML